MEKRILSQLEENIIRQHHHDFGGLSIAETAKKLGCSSESIKAALRRIKKKAPQLFPILTPQHRAILMMYDKHMNRASIATALGITKKQLSTKVAFLRKHNFLWNRTIDQYDPLMDSQVKTKF